MEASSADWSDVLFEGLEVEVRRFEAWACSWACWRWREARSLFCSAYDQQESCSERGVCRDRRGTHQLLHLRCPAVSLVGL